MEVAEVLPSTGIARFALQPSQQLPRNVFVRLATLEDMLDRPQQVNASLVAGEVDEAKFKPTLADYGLRIDAVESPTKYVEVSADQSHAKVFFTLLGDASQVEETTRGLTRAAGFLRTQLAHRMQLRTIPQLAFKYDASIERGVKLSRLIDEAVASSPRKPPGE